uniref:hypothetical protein n=3 Tax=Candidatus Ichthyocystis TaxID=2929841 RepID=UPI0011123593
MYPVAATSAAAFSDVADNGGDNVDNKVCVVQVSGTSDSGLQQIEVPAAVSSTTTSNVATVRKGVGARGKAPARKSAAASTFTPDPGVFDSLGVELHPDSAQTVTVLLSKVDVLAKCIYDGVIRKQLPSGIVDKLTVTGQAVWYGTYRVLCEFGFVHRCLREYHAKHRPGFIRSLSDIKVLSNSSGSDVEMLSGDVLLSFLSKLDSAVRGMVERIFNSNWDRVVGKVFSALEEGSLDDVSCKDFKDVLDIAGVPLVASSLVSRSKTQSLRTHTSNEDIDESTASGGGPSSSMTAEEMDTGGACAGAGVVCATVDGLSPIQCVDLLGVRVHPDSTKSIYGLFSGIRESAKMSYSSSILNHLLTTINSE